MYIASSLYCFRFGIRDLQPFEIINLTFADVKNKKRVMTFPSMNSTTIPVDSCFITRTLYTNHLLHLFAYEFQIRGIDVICPLYLRYP